jgi:hypothetical protein
MADQAREQTTGPDHRGPVRSWPLFLLAAPAGVAIWSGWVGLGELAGFGVVHPLPGIWDDFELNTAITLPIGVEAYAAYALRAWLAGGHAPSRARTFAKRSAIGALILGALGQVAYHLLAAAEVPTAPWWITTLVACLPVAVLGMGAALAHLLRGEPDQTGRHAASRTRPARGPRSADQQTVPTSDRPDQTTTVEQTAGPDQTTEPPVRSADIGPDRNVVPIRRVRQTGPAAVANAAVLADRYPDQTPAQKTVERELGWGAERARAALAELTRQRELAG